MLLIIFHMLPKTGGMSEHIASHLPGATRLLDAHLSIPHFSALAIQQSSGNSSAVGADQVEEVGRQ